MKCCTAALKRLWFGADISRGKKLIVYIVGSEGRRKRKGYERCVDVLAAAVGAHITTAHLAGGGVTRRGDVEPPVILVLLAAKVDNDISV